MGEKNLRILTFYQGPTSNLLFTCFQFIIIEIIIQIYLFISLGKVFISLKSFIKVSEALGQN